MSVLRRFSLPRSRPLSVYTQDDENVRHATRPELFLGLVFVIAVAGDVMTGEDAAYDEIRVRWPDLAHGV